MSIENADPARSSPVGAKCVSLIGQFRGFSITFYSRVSINAALTGLGTFWSTRCYKHIVPTGLKSKDSHQIFYLIREVFDFRTLDADFKICPIYFLNYLVPDCSANF